MKSPTFGILIILRNPPLFYSLGHGNVGWRPWQKGPDSLQRISGAHERRRTDLVVHNNQ